MAYRNKTYVAFDGDSDIHYYRLMQAWKQNDHTPFNFQDAHGLNFSNDSSLRASILAQLRIRFENTSRFVILIGNNTKFLRKFVPWEIDQALSRNLPIICVNLNGSRQVDYQLCPKSLQPTLAVHIPFQQKILQYALEHWGDSHRQYSGESKSGPYSYKPEVYRELGL
jgi:Thoeris protein ThsB, TIR-like domain